MNKVMNIKFENNSIYTETGVNTKILNKDRKLTIKKQDLLAEGTRIQQEKGTWLDQILKNQFTFKIATEYIGIVETSQDKDQPIYPSNPSPLFTQSKIYPIVSESSMVKCSICNINIITSLQSITDKKNIYCIWCKRETDNI